MADTSSTFRFDNLTVHFTDGHESATLRWEGVSDARNPATFLLPFLTPLVARLAGRTVTLDFRKFEFMNSSTVSVILRFVKKLDATGVVETVILYDTKIDWQRVNFLCMRTIARTLSRVDVRAG